MEKDLVNACDFQSWLLRRWCSFQILWNVMEIQPRECQMLTWLKWSPGPSRAELLFLRDVQILMRSLWLIPRLLLFFSCLEEGCVKTYQAVYSLQHHLDLGEHKRTLENEKLLDRAVLGYADRPQEQFCGISQTQVRKSLNLTSQPCLPMGWALKSSHVRRTFTEKQKDYLTSKFRIGETTGQKADAASVAKSMMTSKSDSNGNRLFTSSEFLTGQKVSSFFSRLT